jgi:uncharacterized protein (TIGR00251 family)
VAWKAYKDNVLQLQVHVQPGGRTEGIAGIHGDRLKIRIQAPAVDGRANARLIEFLAAQFGVPKSAITITRGKTGRTKSLTIRQPRSWPAWFNELKI